MNSHYRIDEHVAELLSGYVDGELTQQQRQRVEVHCQQCELCREELRSIEAVRADVRGSALSPLGEDAWRERPRDDSASALGVIGWALLLAGMAFSGVMVFLLFLQDETMDPVAKVGIVGVYLGGAILLLSVARQRWVERKTDKYKDVEI